MQDIVLFSDVDKNDLNLVGGKGANLGELYRHKIPVPDGFIVTSQTYLNALKNSGALDRIRGILYSRINKKGIFSFHKAWGIWNR